MSCVNGGKQGIEREIVLGVAEKDKQRAAKYNSQTEEGNKKSPKQQG